MRTSSGAKLDVGRVVALIAALGGAVVFWDSAVLWPLKLLVVAIHETGHAAATLLVGGSVTRLSVAADESGACLSLLPDSFFGKVVVYSAGYTGSALAGGALLLATFRFRMRRAILVLLAVWLGGLALLFARDFFTILFCVGTATALAVCARWLPDDAVDVLNLFLAAFTAMYAVFDLRSDLWSSEVRGRSDAALLAEVTWIPAVVWAVLWSLFSLAVLGLCVAWSLRGRHRAPEGADEIDALLQRRGRMR